MGRWTVINFSHFDKAGRGYWNCECDCGTKNKVLEYNLKIGQSKSCGCLAGELTAKRHLTHGMEKTRQYGIWRHMIYRCCRPKERGYHNYGGRGIKVCDKWKTFIGFWEDMKDGYSDELSIDRINNDGNYCKENCRWATMTEQQRNRRNNIMYNGECASEASRRLGGKSSFVAQRVRNGWSLERAFTTPSSHGTKRN